MDWCLGYPLPEGETSFLLSADYFLKPLIFLGIDVDHFFICGVDADDELSSIQKAFNVLIGDVFVECVHPEYDATFEALYKFALKYRLIPCQRQEQLLIVLCPNFISGVDVLHVEKDVRLLENLVFYVEILITV